MRALTIAGSLVPALAPVVSAARPPVSDAAAGDAKGTLAHQARTVTFKEYKAAR